MNMLATIGPIILMFVIFYFILIRPQQKRQKKVKEMQSALKKDDKVVTIGGFHGSVHAIDESTVVITGGDGSKLTYDRAAIREVLEQSTSVE